MQTVTDPVADGLQSELEQRFATLAYSVADPKSAPNRNSRFWSRVEPSAAEVKEELQRSLMPKKLANIDDPIERRLRSYKKELPQQLTPRIRAIREFFLTEIAPLTFAVGGGVIQSQAVAERAIETKIDTGMFQRFEQMVARAASLRMARYVMEMFDLNEDALPDILGRHHEKEHKQQATGRTAPAAHPQPARGPVDATQRSRRPGPRT